MLRLVIDLFYFNVETLVNKICKIAFCFYKVYYFFNYNKTNDKRVTQME